MALHAGSFMVGLGTGAIVAYTLMKYTHSGLADADVLAPPELNRSPSEDDRLLSDAGLAYGGPIGPAQRKPAPRYDNPPVQTAPYRPQKPEGGFALPAPVDGLLRRLASAGARICIEEIHNGVQWVIDEAMGVPVVTATNDGAVTVDQQTINARLAELEQSSAPAAH